MTQLTCITWDHVRGTAPIKAATETFARLRQEVSISWDARSLEDFEHYPVEMLAESYDLILMDHPFVGACAEKGVLLPLDEWLSAEYLTDQKKNSVGPSYDSYTWGGHQWGLAVDAAAQASAYRPDLLDDLEMRLPRTWDEVVEVAATLPEGIKVGMTLNPTHAYCCFLALCANVKGQAFWDEHTGIDLEVGKQSLGVLRSLLPSIHQSSLEMSPIRMLEMMAHRDEVAYVPLIFSYSNYARGGFAPRLVRFTRIPSTHEEPTGSVLGGVGLAVSSGSRHKQEAVDFAGYVASREYQLGLYFDSGGQPGYRTAWTEPRINEWSNGFFEGTLRTIDLAYMRPRRPGYIWFQERAGKIVHEFLRNGGDSKEVVLSLNRLYTEAVTGA